MIISWNWLSRYCDLEGIDPSEASVRFTVTTAEIEEVIAPPSREFLGQFKVAKVLSVTKHPNADKLRCCKVDDGEKELDIVCGAANVREGLTTVLAPVGCDFGDGFVIKKSKLRGEPSEGMLCSEKEIGIGSGDEGIVELQQGSAGQSVVDVVAGPGFTWDLDNKAITHRPDLWGHHGLARELATVYGRDLRPLEREDLLGDLGDDGYAVSIEAPDRCRRYCGLSIDGVRVGPSPLWMQQLLTEAGMRPINNVVDATNFVMLELGQPTHAFDARSLPSRDIVVGMAHEGEAFDTLTGKSLTLDAQSLLIRSGGQGVALAGVVGGENSSISDETTEVFLEAAHFEPLGVRKTAQRFDCRTDSSARFEKSLDPCHAPLAISRLVTLLKETCPALKLRSSLVDVFPNPIETLVIDLDPALVVSKMGVEISSQEQKATLESLGFGVDDSTVPWKVTVPSWRNTKDIEEAIDLVEEIGRLVGLERLVPQPPALDLEARASNPRQERDRTWVDHWIHRGFDEIKTYSFTNLSELEQWGMETSALMTLANPLSKEQTHMRPNLLVRQLEAWALNAKHLDAFRCFEFGTVFNDIGERLPKETMAFCAAIYAPSVDGSTFFGLKGDVVDAFDAIGIRGLELRQGQGERPCVHPARYGEWILGGEVVGTMAELHPEASRKLGLKGRLTFVCIDDVLSLRAAEGIKFMPLDRFPAVPFSLSLIADTRTPVGELQALLQGVDPVIQDLSWEGNFAGGTVPEGKKSVTFSMNFRRSDRTMQGDEIQELQDKIIAAANAAGFPLRQG